MDTPEKPVSEADRFRAFAKKVVSVPKAEIDRREKFYQAERKALRKDRKGHA